MFKAILGTLLVVTACHHNRDAAGPMERAGRGVDKSAEKTGTALDRAAVKTGDALDKAGRATGRAFQRVGQKLQGEPTANDRPAPSNSPKAPDH